MDIHSSDVEKILDVLKKNEEFHTHRDAMNAALHLGIKRDSPLTSETISARERLEYTIEENVKSPREKYGRDIGEDVSMSDQDISE